MSQSWAFLHERTIPNLRKTSESHSTLLKNACMLKMTPQYEHNPSILKGLVTCSEKQVTKSCTPQHKLNHFLIPEHQGTLALCVESEDQDLWDKNSTFWTEEVRNLVRESGPSTKPTWYAIRFMEHPTRRAFYVRFVLEALLGLVLFVVCKCAFKFAWADAFALLAAYFAVAAFHLAVEAYDQSYFKK